MSMPLGTYHIHRVTFWEREDGLHQAYVMADMSQMGEEWPQTIQDGKYGKTFKFVSNEIMEGWMVGKYSGNAKYVEVCTYGF